MDRASDSLHFVISAPRSGSTWLARALNQHPMIYATENRLFGSFCELWKNNSGRMTPRITFDEYARAMAGHSFVNELGFENAKQFQDCFLPAYFEFLVGFQKKHSGKSIVVDKITPYLGTSEKVLELIHQYFPSAKIIQLLRDGRDVATSGVFDWLEREPKTSPRYRLFVDNEPDLVLPRFFDDDLLRTWCAYWTEPIQAISTHANEILTVRYESMLEDQSKELKTIFRYLDCEASDEIANQAVGAVTFQQLTGRTSGDALPLAKARKGVAGDWHNYFTKQDARLFGELADQELLQMGYESDNRWIDACPLRLNLHSTGCGET